MNKKFSTLMAGALLATGVVSAQIPSAGAFPFRTQNTKVTVATAGASIKAIESDNKWYQLTDGAEDAPKVLIQERVAATNELILKMVPLVDATSKVGAPLNSSLWKITVKKYATSASKVYTYTNKETGLELVLDDTQAFDAKKVDADFEDVKTSLLNGCNNEWAWYTTEVQSTDMAVKTIYSYFHNGDSVMVMQAKDKGEVIAAKYPRSVAGDDLVNLKNVALQLKPVLAKEIQLTAQDINQMIDAQAVKNAKGDPNKVVFKFNEPNGKLAGDLQSLFDNKLANATGYVAEDAVLVQKFSVSGLTAVADDLTKAESALTTAAAALKAGKSDDAATAATTAATAAKAAAKAATDAATEAGKAISKTHTTTQISAAATTAFEAGATALEAAKDALTTAATALEVVKTGSGAAATAASKAALNAADKATMGKDATAAGEIQSAKIDAYNIRLANGDDFYMVDTIRYQPEQTPSNSPAYKLSDKPFTIDAEGAYLAARYFFKVTYYPSQDSLLIEPLNAASCSNDEVQTKTNWLDTKAGSEWVTFDDLEVGERPSNTDMNDAAVISITATKLSNGNVVPTMGVTETSKGFNTRISFNHTYPYLVRSTEESALYNISLVTKDPNKAVTSQTRVNGSYIVANMAGQLVYARKDKSQDYTHMPATQWVVEQQGCLLPNNNVARVKITNREYNNIVAFEGQLYVDEDGNKYIINPTYKNGISVNNQFCAEDTLKFESIADAKKGYLILKEDTLRENTYAFNQFFNYGEDPYFLNVKDNKTDTLVRAQKEATQFELFIVGADSIKYGYPSTQAGVSQLWRTAYKLKVKDANKVDNDRKFVAVDQNNKYVVALEKDIDAAKDGLRYAQFYFKENNHWVEGAEGKEYYALVDVKDPASTVIMTANGIAKLSIEQGQMDTKPEALGESRTEAFYIGKDNRPLYRSLGKKNSVVKIYTERGTEKEYLYEDGNNKIGYPSAIKDFGYLGITSAGITPEGKETTVALYADYVQKSNDRMPQYLFAVDVDSVKAYTWCKDHGLNPGCSHADPYAGYVAGRYLVNLNDSVDNSINKLQDAAKFKYDNYTRLAFVEAVHRGDSLYVMKNGITLESIMAKDPAGKSYILPAKLDKANEGKVYDIVVLNGKHNNAAFSLRLVDDAEAQDFYLESNGNGNDSGIGSFKGAWVKLQNYVPVLAQTTEDNGNHDGSTGGILETINQAQKFNIAENVDEIPTDSQTPEVSTISVNADYGKVIIKGAAGKTVTVTNVLGQTIANTVISSNEATISASAGLVVVSVEGEEAVKAIVK